MTSELVRIAVDRALCGGSFFVAPPARLRMECFAEESVPWEIYRGHLLAPALARETQRFAAWHLFLDPPEARAEAPFVSIRQARDADTIYVTRQILSEAHEAYEDSPGVILTRPVRRWLPELVETIAPAGLDSDALTHALSQALFLAVIGTSRLPITSLESPLPDFSLGRLAYLPHLSERPQPWTDPLDFLARALAEQLPLAQQAKALETALRSDADAAPRRRIEILAAAGADRVAALLRAVFNGAALSPYTHFVDAFVGLIIGLAHAPWFGPAASLDVLSYMLRHLCRHLSAFDLTLFHNFGANYPDALFLDALLRAYLDLASRDEFELLLDDSPAGRLRRRALRQACLVRKHYEGHRVPDAPTSMGENLRVLPEPFARVPEEQIAEAGKRTRKLFTDQPTVALLGDSGSRMLTAAIDDLVHADELRELGMAVFLDRPLGVRKEPSEVDRTPLVSYEAFSRSIAKRRVRELAAAGWIVLEGRDHLLKALDQLVVPGLPLAELSVTERPGVVSIADAGKAAADFVFLRTTRRSLDELLTHLDLSLVAEQSPELHAWLTRDRDVLLVQHVVPTQPGHAYLYAYRDGQLCVQLSQDLCREKAS